MFIQNYLDGFCSVVEDEWGTSRPSMFINCWPEDVKASKCIGGISVYLSRMNPYLILQCFITNYAQICYE
jgi:hypothetical protein